VRNFKIDNATIGKLVAEIDLENKSTTDVAKAWLAANEATWKAWTATPACGK
jgi:glycine betaine/proline transport system substrate-binding protein